MLRWLLLAVALSGIWVIALRLVVLVATVGIVGSRHCDDDEWRLMLRGQELMSRCVECQVEKWREIVRVLLRGHQQLTPRQAPGNHAPRRPSRHRTASAEQVPAFRFPIDRARGDDQKTLRHSLSA